MQVGLRFTTDIPPGFRESLMGAFKSSGIPAVAIADKTPYNEFKRFSCVLDIYPSPKPYADYGSFRTRSKLLATQLARSVPATLRASPSLRYRAAIPFLMHCPVPSARLGVAKTNSETKQRIVIAISNYLLLTQ
jgi:hypothetical protein